MSPLTGRLEELRREFDASFARPWTGDRWEPNSILCFTAEGSPFAVPLAGLERLAKAGEVAPVPSRSPALLGLTVVQARLMPVYSLARLIHMPPAAAPPAWLAVLRGPLPAALAVDALTGYTDSSSVTAAAQGSAPPFVTGSVAHQGRLHALLDCAALYEAITRPQANTTKGPDQNP